MKMRPTKRAPQQRTLGRSQPDGWWAPRFELDSNEVLGSVSLVGFPSRTPKGHNAGRWAASHFQG